MILRSGFLQTAKVLTFCLLAIPFAGPGSRSVSTLRATSLTRSPDESSDSFLHAELFELFNGANLYGAGRYDDAARQFDHVSNLAAQARHSGGWRARPQYWGAYFTMGKE
jgi:hypothetical protein